MFTIKSNAEFISDIALLDERLKNIRINSIEIDRQNQTIKYNFICDQAVDSELQEKIFDEVEKITSPIFKEVFVSVKKIVSNDQLINNEIYKYVCDNYPSISIFLKPTDVICSVLGDVVKYTLRLTQDGAEYVVKNGALTKLNAHLSKLFCSDFVGNTDIKEKEETFSLLDDTVYESQIQKIEHRTIKVQDVVVIDDESMGDLAVYLEDVHSGSAVVCGTVTDIKERKTKNDKPFLIIHIDDTTARSSGLYFSKKSTFSKIKDITVGEAIIARVNVSVSGDDEKRRNFTFEKINRCTFPKDFVKKEKYKKSAPKDYSLIFPTPAISTVRIKSVFDEEDVVPPQMLNKTFVVFDLETTGIDYMSNGITEIGAVKIVDGKMTEQFTTLVKPDYRITEKNAELTGITEEMVANAPKIDNVMPDFMKFIDGAILVGQNIVDFDIKFIKRFAGGLEYDVKNELIDTLALARSVLPNLRKHDLHTLAEYFGIQFNHHRALSDSYATADVLRELFKLQNR